MAPGSCDGTQLKETNPALLSDSSEPWFSGGASDLILESQRSPEVLPVSMAVVHPHGDPAEAVNRLSTSDVYMQPPSEAVGLQATHKQEGSAAQLPVGLSLKGIRELVELFGISAEQAAPPPVAQWLPTSFPQHTMPRGPVAAGMCMRSSSQQIGKPMLVPMDVGAAGLLPTAQPELHKQPEMSGRVMGAMGTIQQRGPLREMSPRRRPISHLLEYVSIPEMTANKLQPHHLAMPGPPRGRDPVTVEGRDALAVTSSWNHAPEGSCMSTTLDTTSTANPGYPLAGGGIPQFLQPHGARPPGAMMVQDQQHMVQSHPAMLQQVPVNSFNVQTSNADTCSGHPGVQVLTHATGCDVGPVLQPNPPPVVLGIQDSADAHRVLVNSRGVPIVVKPKKVGCPQGSPGDWGNVFRAPEADIELERDPFLPPPGAPPVEPQPPGPLGPMRREAPPGPYRQMVDAQLLATGNLTDRMRVCAQVPSPGQIFMSMQSPGQQVRRPWLGAGGPYKPRKHEPT